METAAIIVAAGRGTRAEDGGVPKQYRNLAGAPVLVHALKGFVEHPGVDAILAVVHDDDRGVFQRVATGFETKLLDAVTGGATRQASVRAGLEGLRTAGPRNVLIHDAARPFPGGDLIGRVIRALADYEGAIPALPVTDTLKEAANSQVKATICRDNLWRAQTPQGFRFDRILEAHVAAASSGEQDFTDDSSIAEWHGINVKLVEGAASNLKLTTAEDFALAEERLRAAGATHAREVRVGQGFDVHAFRDGGPLILCGVELPHDRSLAGHSDADVGLHALTDALLGAIGDGDIGAHFPPSDPKWAGAASDTFLRDAAARIAARGGAIVNVDVTIICEAPKIGPHRDAMRARIAKILEIEMDRVSVKATTSEGLGFTGRGEGIAAQASAVVRLG